MERTRAHIFNNVDLDLNRNTSIAIWSMDLIGTNDWDADKYLPNPFSGDNSV